MIARPLLLLSSMTLLACGGSTPPPASPPTPPPAASSDAGPTDAASAAASIVRFDDLGVSFAVPPGMRVMGDDELASRIRTSANPKLTADLQARAAQKKGLPLLTLAKENATANDRLGLTLIATVVPDDAMASELISHELDVMKDNLLEFAVQKGPANLTLDGVTGTDLVDSYVLHGDNGPTQMHAHMRLFVRKGRAFTVTAVWPASAPPERELEATALLDGLHFYDPAP